MKSTIALLSLVAVAATSPDPQITARAQLGKRQSDPALLGYISASGASRCESNNHVPQFKLEKIIRWTSNWLGLASNTVTM